MKQTNAMNINCARDQNDKMRSKAKLWVNTMLDEMYSFGFNNASS